MGNTRYQTFVAPGNDAAPLGVENSWVYDRVVMIDIQSWETIVNYANEKNVLCFKLLKKLSTNTEFNPDTHITADDIAQGVMCMDKLIMAIESEETDIAKFMKPIPDTYFRNPELIKIIEAVKEVFKESLRLNELFTASVE